MRDKILAALRTFGGEMTILQLWEAVEQPVYMVTLKNMESDGLITLSLGKGLIKSIVRLKDQS